MADVRRVRSWKTDSIRLLHVYSYLFECCYDLALDPKRRVSNNPGWETPLREWHNGY